MSKVFAVCFAAGLAVAVLFAPAETKKRHERLIPYEAPTKANSQLPPDLAGSVLTPMRSAAAVDTFVLHDEDFDGWGAPDAGGYTTVDRNEQIKTFWHVADGTELDGGTHGNLLPLAGARSMWCGQDDTSEPTLCGYATLPGYGNSWNQHLVSDVLDGDSVTVIYKTFFDSEPNYDFTYVEYTFDGGATWNPFAVNSTYSSAPDLYDGTSPTPFLTDAVGAFSPGASSVQVRFRFESDAGWSDEDDLWPTDGAAIVDDIEIQTWSSGTPELVNLEDFESAPPGANAAGIWTGQTGSGYGDFAALYPGAALLQEDNCQFVTSSVWGFFEDPAVANYGCHVPDPRPDVGTVPFKTPEGLYIWNEIWSPPFANTGDGNDYRLTIRVYRDLPLDNLVFYRWWVRSWKDGCAGIWSGDLYVRYGGQRDWFNHEFQIGPYVDPTADSLQIAVGVFDGCDFWCGSIGSGACHGQSPLIDRIRVERISTPGPVFTVRHIDLFQDNFAADGTLVGTARADMALDILPLWNPGLLPGDSVVATIAPLGDDPGGGPAAYLYAAVRPTGQPGKSGAAMGSPDTRAGIAGNRWPFKGTSSINGITWSIFRMDSAIRRVTRSCTSSAPMLTVYRAVATKVIGRGHTTARAMTLSRPISTTPPRAPAR